MTAYTFDQIIDFTRTSAATYVANTGFVTQTPASRNLLTYTQEFDNAAWSKFVGASVTANTTTAPDGTATADTLTLASTANSRIEQTATVSSGQTYTFSVWMRVASGTLSVRLYGIDAGVGSAFTVNTSWQRFSITQVASSGTRFPAIVTDGTAGNVFIWGAQLEAASAASTYTRNVGGVYPPRFDYDPVTLAPRGLLIEEQRTNLLLRSEEFDNASWAKTRSSITANATTSPDGTVDADKLVEDTTASNTHQVGQTFSATSGTSYSFSVYLKAAERTWAFLQFSSNMFADATSRSAYINLSTGAVGTTAGSPTVAVVDAGGGWWRVVLTAAATATASTGALVYLATGNGGASYTGNGTSGIFVYGAQLEAGAFATSYIPTVASQVTRTADVATVTGANFSRWYNQSEGTFVAEYSSSSIALGTASKGLASANDGSGNNRVYGYISNTGTLSELVTNAGATEGLVSFAGTVPNGVTNKSAWVYKVNDFAILNNGGTVAADNTGAPPSTPNRLEIGQHLSGNQLNGHLRRIKYYPTRPSDAQLQALTA